jgi:hypothetical protein
MQSNSQTTGFYVCAGLPLAPHSIPVAVGTLAVVDIPVAADDTPVALDILVVDILEAASAALQILGVTAQLGLPVSLALLLVALQVVVLPLAVRMVALLVVRMAVPGYS